MPDAPLRGEPVARAVFNGLPARHDQLAYLLSLGQDLRWALRFLVCATGAVALAMVLAR
ncbi:MAG: hypothetical protein ACRD0H_02020 [Actinomycetes bacterium]